MSRRFRIYAHDDERRLGPDGLIKDQCGVRYPVELMDGLQKSIATSGFSFNNGDCTDPVLRDAALRSARTGLVHDGGFHRPGFVTTADDHGRAAVERAYLDSVADLTSAWKSDAMPPGAYPVGSGAQEGQSCTINGMPGRLERSDDGRWLVCRPVAQGPSRVDAAPSPDIVPRFMDAATAQTIRDRAYREYVDDLQNAWRG
jgi:hypothetical protein